MTAPPVRVLVVDDSAFARKVIRETLSRRVDVEVVGTARDGLEALERIAELRPDVVTLDLVMPRLDGVGVLEALQATAMRPAVVVISMTDDDSDIGVAALAAGAFDVIKKPTALALDRLYEMSDEVYRKVLAAGRAGAQPRARAGPRAVKPPPGRARVVVIGASTGGPQALSLLLRHMPASFPVPIAIVVHMPPGYTEAFARRLDGESALDVREAREGQPLDVGQAVVARAGMHLRLASRPTGLTTELGVSPLDTPHRPSVDVLFASAAQQVGAGALAVVLTGMGDDGLAGARAVRSAGGRVLTQSEASCVVYGMPRVVDEAGLSSAAADIDVMGRLIQESV